MEVTDELIKNTMDLLAVMAAAHIAETSGISCTQALASFLASRTAEMLYDEPSKLWWDGPAAIAEMFEKERQHTRHRSETDGTSLWQRQNCDNTPHKQLL